MKQPFFSVIIPLYNKERYIKRAINSVLNQTFQDFEIIVVNDGSTDFGVEILKKIKDLRIRIYNRKHQGVSFARNFGIKKSQGKYIAFLDADDRYNKVFLMTIYNLIKKYKSIKFFATSFKTIYSKAVSTRTSYDKQKDCLIDNYILEMSKAEQNDFYLHISSVAIEKKLLLSTGLFYCPKKWRNVDVIGEDFELWIRLSLKYNKVAYSNKLGSIYYRNTICNTTKGLLKNNIDFSFVEKSLNNKINKVVNVEEKQILRNLLYKFYNTIAIQLLIRNKFVEAKKIIDKFPDEKFYMKTLKFFKLYKQMILLKKRYK